MNCKHCKNPSGKSGTCKSCKIKYPFKATPSKREGGGKPFNRQEEYNKDKSNRK